jgi:hypothetical protein
MWDEREVRLRFIMRPDRFRRSIRLGFACARNRNIATSVRVAGTSGARPHRGSSHGSGSRARVGTLTCNISPGSE